MKRLNLLLAIMILVAFAVQAVGLVNFASAQSQTILPPPPGPVQVAQGLAQVVVQIQTVLATIQEKAARGEDTSAELQELQSATQSLQALLSQLQGHLDISAQGLHALVQEGKVPGEVLSRFEAFRADLGNTTAEVLASLATLQAPSPTPLGQRAESARGALQPLTAAPPLTITQHEAGPTKLPHRRSDTPRRKPEWWPAVTYKEPPGPQDLAPTVDAPLTPEIQALAAQLRFKPRKLFAFVRNTIEFQPYFGSLKGAQGTLLEKAANDMDQASLLIALLRASQIPARYVAGEVNLRIKKVMNWVGVETPEAAVEAFTSNGIPAHARTKPDGTITHLSFFHVWVEAYLPRERDNDRERGHGRESERDHDRDRDRHHDRDGDDDKDSDDRDRNDRERRREPRSEWVQLDPSFKQHHFTEGMDLKAATGFEVDTFLLGATSGATINEAQSFFTSLNEPFISQELTRLTNNLLASVQATRGPAATVGDVLGTKRIRAITRKHLHNLAESFPFETFTPQLQLAELPSEYRHFVNFAMFGFSQLFALPELAGKRVTVTYVAATPGDQVLLDIFGPLPDVFLAFIIGVKPRLKVEGQVIAEGQRVTLGSSQILRSGFLPPKGTAFDTNDKIVTTGADYAIALDFQRIPAEVVRQRAERFRQFLDSLSSSAPLPPEGIEESLHLTGLSYFMQVDALSDLAANVSRVIYTRDPSEAVVSKDLRVFFFFGLAFFVERGGASIDVKRNFINPTSRDGDSRREIAWMLSSGSAGSAAEHAVFEQLYQRSSVSTERLLALANSRGIPVFTVDRSNLAEILPQLDTFPVVKQSITEFVNAGLVAIVPRQNQSLLNWRGMGWIVLDRNTGAAGYFIAGALGVGGSILGGGSSGEAFAFDERVALTLARVARELAEAGHMYDVGATMALLGALGIVASVLGGSLILGTIGGGIVVTGIAMMITAVTIIGIFQGLVPPR